MTAAESPAPTFSLDGEALPFAAGQTVLQAALAASRYIPHLCYHPEFKPHGSCKVCLVQIDGHDTAACTRQARAGMQVTSRGEALDTSRRTLVQMLMVEGNHFCPSCEKSGDCVLQAVATDLGVTDPHFDHFYPDRPLDASHPDLLLDLNRCILCELCVRASAEVDGKGVFALGGRGIDKHLVINSASGRLADTDAAASDKAVAVCPVGAILVKRRGFATPIGARRYDAEPISAQALRDAPREPRPATEKP
jgi:[NiFe] hydrogenase diaphorase moiety small subunit